MKGSARVRACGKNATTDTAVDIFNQIIIIITQCAPGKHRPNLITSPLHLQRPAESGIQKSFAEFQMVGLLFFSMSSMPDVKSGLRQPAFIL